MGFTVQPGLHCSLVAHKTITKETFTSANLAEHLDLFFCNITNIEDFAFSNSIQLTFIKLNSNGITELRQNTFAGLPNLEQLEIYFNQISHIEDGALNFPKLRILKLEGNELKTLSGTVFNQLPSLIMIDLSDNGLEQIGRSLYSLQKVEAIWLIDNKIQDIDLKEFAKLPALETLSLRESGFDWSTQADISDDYVKSVNSSLTELELGNKNVTDLRILNKIKVFKNLKVLRLQDTPFEEIPWDTSSFRVAFPKLLSIYVLNPKLNCNRISDLHKEFSEKSIYLGHLTDECTEA